jgi:hypothetical protein
LSPIHRLPNELLNKIFLFACAENVLTFRATHHAVNIAAVCGRWRLLAISYSSLWSSFQIHLRDDDSTEADTRDGLLPDTNDEDALANSQLETCLDTYLKRSRQQPLTLYIVAEKLRDPEGDPEHPLLSKLVAHSSRWKHLTLDVFSISRYNGTSLRNAVATPSLETLTFVTLTGDEPLVSEWILSAFSLRTLFLSSYLPFSNVTTPGSLDRVSSLTSSVDVEGLFKPLNWFPSLQHLRLHDLGNIRSSSNLTAALPCHCQVPITSLEIDLRAVSKSGNKLDLLGLAMNFLSAPSLSKLVINLHQSQYAIEIHSSFLLICGFIERSRCTLTVLDLKNISIADKYVVDLLKHLRSLVDLTLQDPGAFSSRSRRTVTYPISKGLIESLHAHRPSSLRPSLSPIVPDLRSLVLRVRSKNFDPLSFISTISSRWIPDRDYSKKIGMACLRSVELHLSESFNETDYLPLAPFEKAGMRVVVKGM